MKFYHVALAVVLILAVIYAANHVQLLKNVVYS